MPVTIANIPGTEVLSDSRAKLNTNFANLKAAAETLQKLVGRVALTYTSTVTLDTSIAGIFDLTLTGDVTVANPTNPTDGQTIKLRIRQDSTGNRTVTLGSKFRIPSSATTPLPWSTAANKLDIFAAIYNAADDKWDVVSLIPGY